MYTEKVVVTIHTPVIFTSLGNRKSYTSRDISANWGAHQKGQGCVVKHMSLNTHLKVSLVCPSGKTFKGSPLCETLKQIVYILVYRIFLKHLFGRVCTTNPITSGFYSKLFGIFGFLEKP